MIEQDGNRCAATSSDRGPDLVDDRLGEGCYEQQEAKATQSQ
jgi:hypothetical protein